MIGHGASTGLRGRIPPPLRVAHTIAALCGERSWGIGGSLLLYRLDLEPAPADVDIVATPEAFPAICSSLAGVLSPVVVAADARFATRHYARFTTSDGVGVDVMAGIAVRSGASLLTFEFDAGTIEIVGGLPWMRADDWLHLYRLFDRPARVRALEAYLRQRDASS